MSSTMNSPAPAPAPARTTHLTTFLFAVAVVFFLLAGAAIVLGQIVTLAAGDATAARSWATELAPYAFGGASVAGLLSFALSYRHRGDGHGEPDGDGERDRD
ncbi:hypothetical protein ACIBJC_21800 [Streptomyces sp. NPDC050509]|uniref:hypothetical protein n=1 Tax=Streptomyces sp. NPDC050509 TaxID=3365620 RepID=UPI0037BD0C3B